jgi:hypothetical protein
MKSHSILLKICLAFSTVCLCAGYISTGYWQILFVFPILALIWLFVVKYSVFWSASIFLVVYVLLAAIGIFADLSRFLMLIASTTALASWELMQFNQKQVEISLLKSNNLLEKNHIKTLALATSTGFVFMLISSSISLELPFIVTSILVLILFGGFLFGVRIFGNQNS